MYVKRLLSINMAALAALATLMLGMGQGEYLLPVLAFLAACASVWYTDITGWIRLSHRTSNFLVLGAFLIVVRQFLAIDGPSDIAVLGNLLAYIQIVLLFQEKDFRTWWHLGLLSLMQVAVAAAFSQEALFGFLLIVYSFGGLTALSLLYIHYERLHFRDLAQSPLPVENHWFDQDWRRVGKIALATLFVGPASLFLRYQERRHLAHEPAAPAPKPPVRPRRWSLGGEKAAFVGTAPSVSGRGGVGRELWRGLAAMNVATLVLAFLAFLVVPRFDFPDWRYPNFGSIGWGFGLRNVQLTGASDTVQLGDLEDTVEDPQEVMQIRFIDNATGKAANVLGGVYLRGGVLSDYRDGGWQVDLGSDRRAPFTFTPGIRPDDPRLVRQEMTIEPLDTNLVYCVWPAVCVDDTFRLEIDYDQKRLYRPRDRRGRRYSLSVGTTGFVRVGHGIAQARTIPATRFLEPADLLRVPRRITYLRQLAAQWREEWLRDVKPAEVSANNVYHLGIFLENKLRNSGDFSYSLRRQPVDNNIDPIDDFVRNNPSGNCEYFATTLALMLRSLGFPTRMALGFRSEEYNTAGNFFQVRQWHAHTWVEAYLAPDQLPGGVADDDPAAWSRGGWLRLDPTPASSTTTQQPSLARTWLDRIDYFWQTYVRGLNQERQTESVYSPLGGTLRSLVSFESWPDFMASLRALPYRLRRAIVQGRWFSWRGGLAAMGISLVLYLVYRMARWIVRKIWRLISRRRAALQAAHAANVQFYRRLEAALARRGLRRAATQTQREFALAAASHLEAAAQGHLAAIPVDVADAFYGVRFGGHPLDARHAATVDQWVTALETANHTTNGQKKAGSRGR